MVQSAVLSEPIETLADLVEQLGCVPLQRVRLRPALGTATEKDLLANPGGEKPLCELVEGVLVEKTMGYYESRLAVLISYFIEGFLERHDLGIVLGADAMLRIEPGLVRLPDVSFIAWERFPNRQLPPGPILDGAPDLAVEVLSKDNTAGEMTRKLNEYFAAGTRLVWYVYPDTRTLRVFSSPSQFVEISETDALQGDPVLPGFVLPIDQLFERAGKRSRT